MFGLLRVMFDEFIIVDQTIAVHSRLVNPESNFLFVHALLKFLQISRS